MKENTETEQTILRRLRVWIIAMAAICLVTGIGIGAMLAGRPAVAQNGTEAAARAPEALSASFVEIAQRVEPAVVNIETLSAPEAAEGDNADKEDQSQSNPFLDLMRRRALRPQHGVGSGFVIDTSGYILTNHHVIDGATRITIGLASGERFRGKVVGIDQETDLAVIKIDAGRSLPVIKFGDSTVTQVGDWVLAIGSPFGLEQTVTAGIISKKERESQTSNFQRFLQTDAAINRGNSGGPLVNMHGEAIGVNSQIATMTGDYSGIGFALPSNEAKYVYEQIVTKGKVKRGFLGVTLDSVRPEFAKIYNLPETRGAIVADVQAERDGQPTPAAKAGLETNDVIIEFEGQPVQDQTDLIMKVAGTPVGQTATLVFLREKDGKLERHSVSVTLAERPNYFAIRDAETPINKDRPAPVKSSSASLGLTLSELTPQVIAERRLAGVKGLFVKEVDPNGVAADGRPTGVLEGEVITRINRIPVSTLDDFKRVAGSLKPGDAIVLNLSRHEGGRIVQRIVQFTYQ